MISPKPWEQSTEGPPFVCDSQGNIILDSPNTTQEDADHITLCVNQHEQLKNHIRRLESALRRIDIITKVPPSEKSLPLIADICSKQKHWTTEEEASKS